ncbi:MAG: hypothetical protein WCC92_20480 [Candidatus Korobacteraceae bacterium]
MLAAIICSGVFVAASQAQTFTVLHNFTNESGGNLYGNNFEGGPYTCDPDYQGCGTIFELSQINSHWIFSSIYLFGLGPGNGYLPNGQLLRGPGGVLYGTTEYGGACGGGTTGDFPFSCDISIKSRTRL